jgi:hypothetical protein
MDQTNTQGGQDLQSLQPQSSQTQQASSNFQAGSGVDLSGNNTSSLLNQNVGAGNLSVGVASSNSQTSIAAPGPVVVKSSGVPGFFVLILLVLFVLALVLAYRRARKFDNDVLETTPAEEELLGEVTWVTKTKNKKKRKKPKRPHHH